MPLFLRNTFLTFAIMIPVIIAIVIYYLSNLSNLMLSSLGVLYDFAKLDLQIIVVFCVRE